VAFITYLLLLIKIIIIIIKATEPRATEIAKSRESSSGRAELSGRIIHVLAKHDVE
jgi:hypothetical protein